VTAQDFDGKKPLICSTIEVYDCEPGADCIKGQARDIDAPQFFFLDFESGMARTVRAGSEERTSAIKTVQSDSGQLILQGAQYGRAWSATISQESGTLVLSVAGEDVAFVLFGACTPM
jgi:hypothetical protein